MTIKSAESLLDDLESVANQPGWIEKFRIKYYNDASLPFLIVYQASAIANNPKTPLYKDKSGAIAIATTNLQNAGCLLKKTNALSERGDVREIAVMARLGKAKTLEYIQKFEAL